MHKSKTKEISRVLISMLMNVLEKCDQRRNTVKQGIMQPAHVLWIPIERGRWTAASLF